ncbi:hypothetical protein HYW75_04015 [Candidatus Pacearchaeota archaeon]|nr:hypothetical protein [Candidatus Pacearchaeota archaeon]
MKDEYKDYHGKDYVHIVVDGRGLETEKGDKNSNVSLEFVCSVTGESDSLLHMQDIRCRNLGIFKTSADIPFYFKFTKGSVNKDYVIGIFIESPEANR